MNDLTKKANGAKTVTPATETKVNEKEKISKNTLQTVILETTAEKRLKNLEHFQKICQKYNFLKGKNDDLTAYLTSRDGLKETAKIENTDGQVFEISNTFIISEILQLCQDKLFDLVEKAEKEVTDFQI